jgi:hypothetical protein
MKSMHYYSDVGLPYPDKDQYTTVFVYHKGKVLVDGMAHSTCWVHISRPYRRLPHTANRMLLALASSC